MHKIDLNCELVDQEQHLAGVVMNNTIIVDTNHKLDQLELLKAYYIRTPDPAINFGLKALKDLQHFK